MKSLVVLSGIFFLVSVLFSVKEMPKSIQETTASGAWCTHYLVPNTCPNILIDGGRQLGCPTVNVSVPWYWCFYTLDTVPTMSNCTAIPSPNFPNVNCGYQVISSSGSGGCSEHIACAPLM
jgi:hypothetical protein